MICTYLLLGKEEKKRYVKIKISKGKETFILLSEGEVEKQEGLEDLDHETR